MNQKITFPELVNAVAEATKTSKRVSEDFLKELFSLIASTLATGENVKIKKLGTFKVSVVEQRKSINVSTGEEYIIPEHRKITFIPDKELAEAVNEPFAAFESVELADEITEEMLNADLKEPAITIEAHNENSNNNETPTESIVEETDDLPQINWDNSDDDIKSDNDIADHDNPKPQNMSADTDTHETISPDSSENYTEELTNHEETSNYITENPKKKSFLSGYLWGILTTIIIIITIITTTYLINPGIINQFVASNEISKTTENKNINQHEENIISDSISIDTIKPTSTETTPTVDTKPSDQPVYDTISRTRFLTTMAKEHYGNYNLWPYIYEENCKILGHPDRIKPGTKVIIPPKEKYNIDPNNEECIRKAKQKGVEIYRRYKQ